MTNKTLSLTITTLVLLANTHHSFTMKKAQNKNQSANTDQPKTKFYPENNAWNKPLPIIKQNQPDEIQNQKNAIINEAISQAAQPIPAAVNNASTSTEKTNPIVSQKKGFFGKLLSSVWYGSNVEEALTYLEQEEEIPKDQIEQLKHTIGWAINEISEAMTREITTHEQKEITGIQSTLTNNETSINNLKKIVRLGIQRKIITDGDTLAKIDTILSQENTRDDQYFSMVTEQYKTRREERKAVRKAIHGTKIVQLLKQEDGNSVSDLSDDEDENY